jgi:NADPH-dependent F420 reductase
MRSIGLIGGTGDIGSALAVQLAKSFETVLVGSRNQEKANSSVKEIISEKPSRLELKERLRPVTNEFAVSTCDDLVLTVPYGAAIGTINSLSPIFKDGQLLISAVAAITKSGKEFEPVRSGNSVAGAIKEIIPRVKVSVAFQTVPARVLYEEREIDADVFVCSDEDETFKRTSDVITSIKGLHPIHVGSLAISEQVEGLTALLLNIGTKSHLKTPTFKIKSF